ncbi:uncharacterized protein NPIL_304421 [Nephila pilipes]|uniref:Uncharacterized protein n=1 Tax=Nephila pilipes TaxID=299642 RepID=A0A8X6QCR2_NEPPI|nr:uncharacterized protein NPIL_304421 [Nephila pilipes]
MDSAFCIVEKCHRPNKKFKSEKAIFQVIVDPDRWLMSNGAPTIGFGKTNRRVRIPSLDRLIKKSIWCVPDDNLNICCAEAILLAIAEVGKDTDLESSRRKDCDLLKRGAIALHQKNWCSTSTVWL